MSDSIHANVPPEMRKPVRWLCQWEWHDWSAWAEWQTGGLPKQMRRCVHCGKKDVRVFYHSYFDH